MIDFFRKKLTDVEKYKWKLLNKNVDMKKRYSRIMRQLDYALSMSYMRMLGYLCLTFVVLLVLVMVFLWGVSYVYDCLDLGEVNIPGTAFMLLTDPGNISSVLPNNHSWILGVVYAIIAVVGAVLFGGALISIMSNSFQLRVEDFKNGNIHYVHDGHIIVIGYDAVVPALVKQLIDYYPQKDIIVFAKKNSQEVREAIGTLVDVKNKHVLLYSGRRDSDEDLAALQAEKAKEIFIIGNRENDEHDALNFACLSKLVGLIKQSGVANQPIVNILLENQATQVMLQSTNLSQEWRKYIRVIPFNFYENWARQVLSADKVLIDSYSGVRDSERKEFRYPHILVNHDSNEQVNIVIIGMSRLGITIGVEAAHALHFPKLPNGETRKTTITFVSMSAYEEMKLFRARYRQLFEIQSSKYIDFIGNDSDTPKDLPKTVNYPPTYFSGKDADFLDINFEFIRGNAFSEEIHNFLKDRVAIEDCRMSVFACTGHDTTDMNIGLLLPDEVLRRTNIFIRQHHTGQLLTWLHDINEKENSKYANVYPFGMANGKFDLSHESQEMGILINYFYVGKGTVDTYRQDHSLTTEECRTALSTWNEETSIADQWSSFYCCNSFALKLAQWGIESIDESQIGVIREVVTNQIDKLAYIEHNRWNMEKLLLGFRKPHQKESLEIENCRKEIADTTKDEAEKQRCKFRIYKSRHFVHDYIRSFDDLGTISWKGKDVVKDDVRKIDNNMLAQIPWIIRNRKQIQQIL